MYIVDITKLQLHMQPVFDVWPTGIVYGLYLWCGRTLQWFEQVLTEKGACYTFNHWRSVEWISTQIPTPIGQKNGGERYGLKLMMDARTVRTSIIPCPFNPSTIASFYQIFCIICVASSSFIISCRVRYHKNHLTL